MDSAWTDLLELADPGSLERGRVYAREHRVRISSQSASEVLAVVQGSDDYDVRLRGGSSSCDCPMGIAGVFCKHCVAVAIVAGGGDPVGADLPEAPTGDLDDAVVSWLGSLDDDQLQELVLEAAALDEAFAQALALRAARATGDLNHLEDLVDSTLRTRRFLGWRESNEYGYAAHQLVDELEEVLAPETADRLLPLLERAVRILYRVILRADDSSGQIGHAVGRLLDLHALTANAGAPDPKRLARWLVKAGIDDNEFFTIDIDDYAGPLGEKGLALYRREVERRSVTKPDDFHVRRALERLAVLDKDVPKVVELVGRDLQSPHQHLRVVEALQDMDERDLALKYALDGLQVPGAAHQVKQLYDAAADLLTETGDTDRVVQLRHDQLDRLPDESSYNALRKAAKPTPAWPGERAWALDVLLTRNPRAWLSSMLAEGEIDQAWDAAQSMELDAAMWHKLLRARATNQPGDVFDGYVMLVNAELQVADQGRYRQACAYLRELRKASERSGRRDDFDKLVQELITGHKRRPTLVGMLVRLT